MAEERDQFPTRNCKELLESGKSRISKLSDKTLLKGTGLSTIISERVFGMSRSDQKEIAVIKNDLRSMLIYHELIHSRFFHAMALKVASEKRGGINPDDFEASQIIFNYDIGQEQLASEIYAAMSETINDKAANKTSLDLLKYARKESLAFFESVPPDQMISEFSLALFHWAKIVETRAHYIGPYGNGRKSFLGFIESMPFSAYSLFKNGKSFIELGLEPSSRLNLVNSDWNNLLNGPELQLLRHKTFYEDMDLELPASLGKLYVLAVGGVIGVVAAQFLLDGRVENVVQGASAIVAAWSAISSREYTPTKNRLLTVGDVRASLYSDEDIEEDSDQGVTTDANENTREANIFEGEFEVIDNSIGNQFPENKALTLEVLEEAIVSEENYQLDLEEIHREHYLTVGNSAARIRQGLNKIYYENYFSWMQILNQQEEKSSQLLEKVKAKSVLSQQEVQGIQNLEDVVYRALKETALVEEMANKMTDFLTRDLTFVKNALEIFQEQSSKSSQPRKITTTEMDIERQSEMLNISMSQHQKFVDDLPIIYKALSDTASFLRKLQEADLGSLDLNIEDYQSKINTLMDFVPRLEDLQVPSIPDLNESVPAK